MTPEPAGPPPRRDDLRTLGLPLTASAEEVLRSYLKLRRALRKDSPAIRSAASEVERHDMLRRIEEAYRRLCSQAGLPLCSGAAIDSRAASGAGSGRDPSLDLRSRPSPFRARPSRPLS